MIGPGPAWLECKVSPSTFSGEKVFEFTARGGAYIGVSPNEACDESRVRVTVEWVKGNWAQVWLPDRECARVHMDLLKAREDVLHDHEDVKRELL